jgi:DNA-binding transcriptional LysR family regulator
MAATDLSDLDAFVAVAQARSFRGAARTRSVSASALSEAIRRLEKRLRVRLLNRTTRSVTPTAAGSKLLERLTPALSEIGGALDAINDLRDSPVGTLRLNVPTGLAATVLPPIVTRFLEAYPGITMEVIAEDTFVDMVAEGFDAGIRYEERVERDMIAAPIGPRVQRFMLAAAPAYLARNGTPKHPRELIGHACIRHRFAGGALAGWEFARGDEVVRINPGGRLIASNGQMEIAAAVAGLGLLHTFEDILKPAIDAGDLVPVLRDWCLEFSGPLLYYPSRAHVPAPLRAFIDFVKKDGAAAPRRKSIK